MKILTVLLLLASIFPGFTSAVEAAPLKRFKPGHVVNVLPETRHVVKARGNTYYFHNGHFFRRGHSKFVVITAPIGVVVSALPRGYLTFGIGLNRYFYVSGTYYRQAHEGYEVIEQPKQAETVLASGSDRIIIYPAAGQSDVQKDRDRYECYVWASDDTGFDPGDSNSDPVFRPNYQRAMSACLEARNYVVK